MWECSAIIEFIFFRLVIVITDGESKYPEETVKEAKAVRDTGISILAVGIKVRYFTMHFAFQSILTHIQGTSNIYRC